MQARWQDVLMEGILMPRSGLDPVYTRLVSTRYRT